MFPFLGLVASFLAMTLLFGGARLLPTGLFTPGASAHLAAAGSVLYIPAGAHASGANGANWRTDVEFHNPGSTTASFTVQLLKRDTNNASPASKPYTLGARQARRFGDMLLTEFGLTGAAALRVVVTSGSLLVTSRTYNLVGQNPWNLPQGASFGQFVPGLDETEAIGYGQEGRLVHLTQRPSGDYDGFRTNIGIVNASSIAIDVRIDFYRADGTWLGKKDGGDTNLPPYGFRQLDQAFGAWGTLADVYAIVKPVTSGGALFAFATVIDNHVSGDPVFIPAVRRTAGATQPTPTPTTPLPTPTPTGSKPNIYLFKPAAWPACIVANYQTGCCGSFSGCCSPFNSTYYRSFIQWIVANDGQVTLTGPVRFSVAIDGNLVTYADWANSTGLESGYGKILELEYTGEVPAGTHTLTITADPQQTIAETNEGDNACAASASWSSIVFLTGKAGSRGVPGEIRLTASEPQRLTAQGIGPLSAAGTVYVPASAHASGMNGANWRTDVEVHNPNTTEVTYQVSLLKRATDNGGTLPAKTFSLGPQQSVRYPDILSQLFQYDGAAALRFVPTGGATILVNSRTYNLIGANGVGLPVGASFSQFVPGLDENASAITYGEEGRIIQLTQRDASSYADFRTNIGYVNTTASPIDLAIDLYSKAGDLLGTIQDSRTHLRAYEFLQIDSVFGAFASYLDDGYAVIRTTTPGGRFLAFATVIDNHLTGDPVFVPAMKRTASTSPTPTPTPTTPPVTGNQPVGTIETINDIMTGLGMAGTGSIPTIETAVHDVQTRGVDAIITDMVNRYPTRVTRVTNGVKVDYGNGFTMDNGTVLTGQVTATSTNLSVTSTKVTGTYAVHLTNFTKNGGYATIQDASVSFNLDTTSQGRVSGEVGIIGGGTSPVGNTTVTGSAHIDTGVCPKYPISGYVSVTRSASSLVEHVDGGTDALLTGETRRITFTPACDGSYTYDGTGHSPYLFEGQLLKCDGTPQAYSDKISVAVEGNHLTVNPTCGTTGGPKWHKVSGTRTPTSVRFVFKSTFPGDRTHVYDGVFQGTSSNGGTSYSGTSTFTVTVYDGGGSVACSSPPYQKQGTLWLNTTAPCWP
jgi:hypothetical protein